MLERIRRAWPRRHDASYPPRMGIARRDKRTPAVPPPPDMSRYRGLWVAVKGDVVVAAAETPAKLVYELSKLSEEVRREAVMQKAHQPSSDILVGLG